ncbi:hypothetical protein PAXRUDRAFT_288739 [Paxillus rubicundulus Ve08.2h10]|uniref:Uncharacterized protein n=1 Tax=Paxillus rubicundulus Ve08.2h10 TaxID=930991 RepID=A0A0D0DFX8_9AGAM|nr:hypothetical protein PAXRUDRAFT_288739 [Paxillus rubicundulus Ve08.2h10]
MIGDLFEVRSYGQIEEGFGCSFTGDTEGETSIRFSPQDTTVYFYSYLIVHREQWAWTDRPKRVISWFFFGRGQSNSESAVSFRCQSTPCISARYRGYNNQIYSLRAKKILDYSVRHTSIIMSV